eukprot:CAMPEP_0178978706 /NCGR_PEP_ID=MMETSP0789-20121207/25365_1 /TAXON_ID=3005 /ORGANISM="Rhizosolenia setigera, Strain CCMP 1694" /LENGTH=644 /DNA_ID=CAMNT_0020668589 /DNA_START=62 /DNA_END=1996 /DNA_ORIENTATION=+
MAKFLTSEEGIDIIDADNRFASECGLLVQTFDFKKSKRNHASTSNTTVTGTTAASTSCHDTTLPSSASSTTSSIMARARGRTTRTKPKTTMKSLFSFCILDKVYLIVPPGCYALVTCHGEDMDYEYDDEKITVNKDSIRKHYHPVNSNHSTGGSAASASSDDDESTKISHSAVWPEGIHFPYPPWVKIAALVTKRSTVYDVPLDPYKTKDNIVVYISVQVVFRIMGDVSRNEDPEHVRNFVYSVGPRGLEEQFKTRIHQAIQSFTSMFKHTEIYGFRFNYGHEDTTLNNRLRTPKRNAAIDTGQQTLSDACAQIYQILHEDFSNIGIMIIKSIDLPVEISSNLSQQPYAEVDELNRKLQSAYEKKKADVEDEIDDLVYKYEEMWKEQNAIDSKRDRLETLKLQEAIELTKKVETEILKETDKSVEDLISTASQRVQEIRDRTSYATTYINSGSKKMCAELLAETELEMETLMSKSLTDVSKNLAKAEAIYNAAEAKISPWLRAKREFTTRMKEIQVFNELSENEDLILTDGRGDGGSNSGSPSKDDSTVNLMAAAESILQSGSYGGSLLAKMALLEKGTGYSLASSSPSSLKKSDKSTYKDDSVDYYGEEETTSLLTRDEQLEDDDSFLDRILGTSVVKKKKRN